MAFRMLCLVGALAVLVLFVDLFCEVERDPQSPERIGAVERAGLRPGPGAVEQDEASGATESPPLEPEANGQAVTGRVVAAETGAPLARVGPIVAVCDGAVFEERSKRWVETNESGEFEIVVGANHAKLFVGAPGRVPWLGALGSKRHFEVSLEEGSSIHGRVQDIGGEPIPGAEVWCVAEGEFPEWPVARTAIPISTIRVTASATSDWEGRFTLRGLSRGTRYSISARRLGWHPRTAIHTFPGSVEASVVMLPRLALAIRVRDANSGVDIALRRVSADAPSAVIEPHMTPSEQHLQRAPSRVKGLWEEPILYFVAADGSSRLVRIRLRVSAPGYETSTSTVSLAPWTMTKATVQMTPTFAGRPTSVRFSPHFIGSNHATGPIRLMIRHESEDEPHVINLNGAKRTADVAPTSFQRALRLPYSLPPGRYHAQPEIEGTAGMWCRRAGPEQFFEVSEHQREAEVELPLIATPVRLNVVSSTGVRVVGYDVSVPTSDSRVAKHWDFPESADEFSGFASERWRPVLWLPKGHAEIQVSKPGIGSAVVKLRASGDGGTESVTLRLE